MRVISFYSATWNSELSLHLSYICVDPNILCCVNYRYLISVFTGPDVTFFSVSPRSDNRLDKNYTSCRFSRKRRFISSKPSSSELLELSNLHLFLFLAFAFFFCSFLLPRITLGFDSLHECIVVVLSMMGVFDVLEQILSWSKLMSSSLLCFCLLSWWSLLGSRDTFFSVVELFRLSSFSFLLY